MNARPCLEELEPRLLPSDYKLPPLLDGEKQLYKDTLKALEASYRLVRSVPAQPTMQVRLLGPPTGGGSVGRVQTFAGITPLPGRHRDPEDALLLWEPSVHLAMSSYQVKTLDDLFASMELRGGRDPKTGRFVGFAPLIRPLVFARPLGTPVGDTPLATDLSEDG